MLVCGTASDCSLLQPPLLVHQAQATAWLHRPSRNILVAWEPRAGRMLRTASHEAWTWSTAEADRKEGLPSACWARFAAARLVRRAAMMQNCRRSRSSAGLSGCGLWDCGIIPATLVICDHGRHCVRRGQFDAEQFVDGGETAQWVVGGGWSVGDNFGKVGLGFLELRRDHSSGWDADFGALHGALDARAITGKHRASRPTFPLVHCASPEADLFCIVVVTSSDWLHSMEYSQANKKWVRFFHSICTIAVHTCIAGPKLELCKQIFLGGIKHKNYQAMYPHPIDHHQQKEDLNPALLPEVLFPAGHPSNNTARGCIPTASPKTIHPRRMNEYRQASLTKKHEQGARQAINLSSRPVAVDTFPVKTSSCPIPPTAAVLLSRRASPCSGKPNGALCNLPLSGSRRPPPQRRSPNRPSEPPARAPCCCCCCWRTRRRLSTRPRNPPPPNDTTPNRPSNRSVANEHPNSREPCRYWRGPRRSRPRKRPPWSGQCPLRRRGTGTPS